MAIDSAKVEEFAGQVLGDIGGALTILMARIGDELGLYKALSAAGACTPAQLAAKTQTAERYVREWLSQQAAAGWITYDPGSGTFTLPAEHAAALADETSVALMAGAFDIMQSLWHDFATLTDAFRSGNGIGWGEHHPCLFRGTERFFRPAYSAHLVPEWIPSLEGVEERLRSGARVADVGCGLGTSTLVLARAFPTSSFVGFDFHAPSIERANAAARDAGVAERVRFEVARAKDFPGRDYDLVCFFDCLHDMGDPEGAARHVLESLAPEGTWMIVEPMAQDRLEDNLTPAAKIFYGASTGICTPASLAQEVGLALGAQAGEKRLREILERAGFRRIRRSAETPFNMVLEARR